MRYAFVFGTLGLVCFYYAMTLDLWSIRLLAGWCGFAFGGVGAAYAGLGPHLFGKCGDGRIHPVLYYCFGPFHLLNYGGLLSFRWRGREQPITPITGSILLGCRLLPRDQSEFSTLNIKSVLDVCCEFEEVGFIRRASSERLTYRSLPTLDARAPSLEAIETGVQWMKSEAERGRVYVHCALGHGRSATFVAAYLLYEAKCETLEEAIATIATQRPGIELSHEQKERLREWEQKMMGAKARSSISGSSISA